MDTPVAVGWQLGDDRLDLRHEFLVWQRRPADPFLRSLAHASGDPARRRQHVADQLDALAGQFGGYACDAGDISTRSGKAHDQARADRISGLGHHDRDFPRRLLCRHSGGREPSDDDIDLETNQLSCQFGKPVDLSFRRNTWLLGFEAG